MMGSPGAEQPSGGTLIGADERKTYEQMALDVVMLFAMLDSGRAIIFPKAAADANNLRDLLASLRGLTPKGAP